MQPIGKITGRVQVLDREGVDTDQIIPSRFLRTTATDGYAQGLFADLRHDLAFAWAAAVPVATPILLAGSDFGIGSSREHAVWALQEAGFAAIVSERFGDIFRANALTRGLLTAVVEHGVAQQVLSALRGDPAASMELDLAQQSLAIAGAVYHFEVPGRAREMLLHGRDAIGETLTRSRLIDRYEQMREPVVQLAPPSGHGLMTHPGTKPG